MHACYIGLASIVGALVDGSSMLPMHSDDVVAEMAGVM
jgi:hypothetical protein